MMETTWWTRPEQLDDAQKEVVALKESDSHLVIGPPGSGKTNLLILRAAHLYAAGMKNIAVLTFGRVLREFLTMGTGNYELPSDRIQTYVKWGARLLSTNDDQMEKDLDFEQLRPNLLARLQDLAKQREITNKFDCILIDEVQDYSPAEIETIMCFGERFFFVGDDRQRIYETEGALKSLQSKFHTTKRLPYHYRNGIKICRVADGIQNQLDSPDGLESSSNYDEAQFPSTVIDRADVPLHEQIAAAIPDIQTQLRAYPDGMVGVLCPRHKELDEVWKEFSTSHLADEVQMQRYADGYTSFDPERRVVLATCHGAKGLEFRALHLLGMDKISRFQKQRNLAYTSVTRAKTSLTIYHHGPLPGYLEKGIFAATKGVMSSPTLDSLFKKR